MAKKQKIIYHEVEIDYQNLAPGLERISCNSDECLSETRVRDVSTPEEEWDYVKDEFLKRHPCKRIRVPHDYIEVV